jgi:hypothetical protein
MGVSSSRPDPTYLVGAATAAGIEFDPGQSPCGVGNRRGLYIDSELHMTDDDHFEWRVFDGRWRFVYRRVCAQYHRALEGDRPLPEMCPCAHHAHRRSPTTRGAREFAPDELGDS